MKEENQESWSVAEGELEGGLAYSVRYRDDLPSEKELKKLDTLIQVSWFFEPADGALMPPDEILDQMEDFENLMDEVIVEKGTARLMAVFTGEDVREWLFYTDDEEFFIKKFNEAMDGQTVLPLEIEAFEDKDWNAYKDYTGVEISE
jgi:hypothetical protein